MDVENATISELRERVIVLEAKLAACKAAEIQDTASVSGARPKIAEMSSEVVDSNPYSRLMALKRMGIVDNYEVRLPYPLRDLVRFSLV